MYIHHAHAGLLPLLHRDVLVFLFFSSLYSRLRQTAVPRTRDAAEGKRGFAIAFSTTRFFSGSGESTAPLFFGRQEACLEQSISVSRARQANREERERAEDGPLDTGGTDPDPVRASKCTRVFIKMIANRPR